MKRPEVGLANIIDSSLELTSWNIKETRVLQDRVVLQCVSEGETEVELTLSLITRAERRPKARSWRP